MGFIQLINITKTYKGKNVETPVFKNLSLTINEGEFIAIVGRSGSGKSTLLHIMALLDRPNEGEVIFKEKKTLELSNEEYAKIRNEDIGLVFQDFKLIPDMTVMENIEVPLAFAKKKFSRSKRRELVIQLLEELNLNGKENAYPDELSGGQKQRVAIARAIINEPKIVLADEPTGNLDENSAMIIMDILSKLNKLKGITIILVTHDLDTTKYATKTIKMDELYNN